MSDAVAIILIIVGFVLAVIILLLVFLPEELKALVRRLKAVDAGSDGISFEFFETQARKAAKNRGGDPPEPPEENIFNRVSILWIDDNPENNFHEAMMFEALGADVRFATSNAMAVDLATEDPPALLLSDIGRENVNETGLEIPKRFSDAAIPLPPLIHYIGTKTGERSPDGNVVTSEPKELFSAALRALGSQAK